jgi:hypothetical protein
VTTPLGPEASGISGSLAICTRPYSSVIDLFVALRSLICRIAPESFLKGFPIWYRHEVRLLLENDSTANWITQGSTVQYLAAVKGGGPSRVDPLAHVVEFVAQAVEASHVVSRFGNAGARAGAEIPVTQPLRNCSHVSIIC